MGFFNKKPSKKRVYTLSEAMKLLRDFPGYTTIETTGGFRLVDVSEERKHIENYRARRDKFMEQMSGNGAYRGIKANPNSNDLGNWQNRNSELWR